MRFNDDTILIFNEDSILRFNEDSISISSSTLIYIKRKKKDKVQLNSFLHR